jgi:hypothetical protein
VVQSRGAPIDPGSRRRQTISDVNLFVAFYQSLQK